MRKKQGKMLALFLSLSMLALCLAGCGSNSNSDSEAVAAGETEPQAVEAETVSEEEAETTEEFAEAPAETEDSEETTPEAAEEEPERVQSDGFVAVPYSFPLTDKPETLSFFTTLSPNVTSYITDYGENAAVQALEELTGVHIEYSCYLPENAQTQFNLMAVSGALPDMVTGASEYSNSSIDSLIEEELVLNLGAYLDLCPNFSSILELAPNMETFITSDAGNILGFYPYSDPDIATPVSGALMIRGDWLEQVGLDVPTTYDEVHDVLVAFKAELGLETPMIVTSYLDDMGGSFASGYDIKAFFMTSPGIQVPFYVVDGEVKCAIVEDDFVSYLSLLRSYIDEGLVAQDIESYSNENSYKDKVLNGEVGVFWGFGIGDLEVLNSQVEDGGYFVVCQMIRKTEDQTLHFVQSESYDLRYVVSITPNCENVELACKWLDAHYTDEVSMLSMYGVEGVSFVYDGDTPHYTEMMTDTSEGRTLSLNQALYCLATPDTIAYNSINTALETYTEAQVEALEYINSGSADGDYVYPDGASMTTEEGDTYSSLISDLSTYMAEHVLKFVTGQEDLADYPAFVENLMKMGMQEAIDIKQAAYDRYVSK